MEAMLILFFLACLGSFFYKSEVVMAGSSPESYYFFGDHRLNCAYSAIEGWDFFEVTPRAGWPALAIYHR